MDVRVTVVDRELTYCDVLFCCYVFNSYNTLVICTYNALAILIVLFTSDWW